MNIVGSIRSNWQSGLTVALVSIPLSISLAIASGVNPQVGIITAVWAGLCAALFGGSNYNVIGPTGALSGVIAAYVLAHGPEAVSMLALITGCYVLIAYALNIEKYLIFIPSSVIHGFTLGVALIIICSQLNYALGLDHLPKPPTLIAQVMQTARMISHASWPAVLSFLSFLLSLRIMRKIIPQIPTIIILSPIGICLGYLCSTHRLPYELSTLGDAFGHISTQLFKPPHLFFDPSLLTSGGIIALIAIIETALSAKIADVITKTRHNRLQEILGLAIANIVSGLCGGIPATAALARTSLNIKSGATSRYSAIVSSIFIGIGAYILLPYFTYMPLAVIAAILIHVAINMIEYHHFYRLWIHDKKNLGLALLVAFITIFEDPIIGILIGTVIALLLLLNILSEGYYELDISHMPPHTTTITPSQLSQARKQDLLIYSLKGKLVYINNQSHILRLESEFKDHAGIVLRLRDLYFIDLDGVDALDTMIDIITKRNQRIFITEVPPRIKEILRISSKTFRDLEAQGLVFDHLSDIFD